MCTIRILKNDYDDVIQLPKVASEAGVNGTPVPSLCPTGRDGTLSPVKESTVLLLRFLVLLLVAVGWLIA